MEYLGIHGYWRSAYCESCFAAEMGDSSLEHTDMQRKTNSFSTFMSPKDLHTFLLLLLLFFFAEIKDQMQIMTFVLHIKSQILLDFCIMWF